MIFYRPAQDKVLRIRRLVCTMHIPLNNRSSDLYSQDQLLLELKRLHLTISTHEACDCAHVIRWLLWNRTNLNHIFICCTDTKFTMSCAEIYTFTNLLGSEGWFSKPKSIRNVSTSVIEANMPKKSTWNQFRLNFHFLRDVQPRHCKEIHQVAKPKKRRS